MNDLFDKAVNGSGAEFLEAERTLRRTLYTGRADSDEVLKRAAQSSDPVARLFGEVLEAGRATGGRDYDDVESLFENMPKRAARTPLGSPPQESVESVLTREYAGRVTKFIAWRLVKELRAPDWRVGGSLLYLQAQKDLATTAAIVRFVMLTPFAERREWGLEALKEIGDPTLGTKLGQAEAWGKAQKTPFPPELRTLSTKAP